MSSNRLLSKLRSSPVVWVLFSTLLFFIYEKYDQKSDSNSPAVTEETFSPQAASSPSAPPQGSLLGTTSPARPIGSAKPIPVPRDGTLFARLGEVPVDPKVEALFRILGEKGSPVAGELLLYLRAKHGKRTFNEDEQRLISGELLGKLTAQPEAMLTAIGKSLTALDGVSETTVDRMELMNLVAIVPVTENREINRNAISTLTKLSRESSESDDRSEWMVMAVQAYLASTGADAEGAQAALLSAMGGKVDPAIQEVYSGAFRERFPQKP